MIFKQFSRSVLLVAAFAFLGYSAYAQGDAAKGEALFKAKCTTCHKIDIRVIGPPLGPTISSETDDKWLTKWIQKQYRFNLPPRRQKSARHLQPVHSAKHDRFR